MEKKFKNIVYNPELENTKVTPIEDATENIKEETTKTEPVVKKFPGLKFSQDLESNITYDKSYNIDLDEYRGQLGSDIYMPGTEDGIDVLNRSRADNQSAFEQAGGFLAQTIVGEMIGGTIEGVGYLLDWEGISNIVRGKEQEYANWLSDFGKGIRSTTEKATRIYETEPGEMNFSDSGYWFKNSVSIASSLSMLLPALGGARALGYLGRGASKVAGRLAKKGAKKFGKEISEKAFDLSANMGVRADWTASGISQAVVSRHIENSMEASGTFESIYDERITQLNPKTGDLFTKDEAKRLAADGASENYKHGWAMLAQDVVQYLSIGKVFNPIARKMVVANKFAGLSKVPKWAQKTAGAAGTFVSEAGEEGYQHYIASRAKLNSNLRSGLISQEEFDAQLGKVMESDEAATSMLFGGLGGSVFQMVGPKANDILKSKSKKEFETKASEIFKNSLDNKNKVYAALQIEKNKGDQEGTQEEIEMQQEDLILSMVLDGLDNDNLEMVMEAIENGPELTAEEIAKFGEENGYEWDNEIAKAGAKRALQIAKEVKEIHFKNKDKARNKNVDPAIIKSMSRIEFQNKEFSLKLAETKNKNRNRVESLRFDGFLKPTDNYREAKEINSRIEATKTVIRRQETALKRSVDKDVKNERKQLIKGHSYSLSQLEKRAKELAEKNSELSESSDESAGNKMAEKIYQNASPEIKEGYARELEINDAITQNQLELVRLNDENFQKALVNKQTEAAIQRTTSIEKLEVFKKQVQKGKVTGYSSKKDLERTLTSVNKRIDELTKEKNEKEAAIKNKQAVAELDKEIDLKNEDEAVPDNNVVVDVDTKGALEDEHSSEEIWFEDEFTNEQEEATETKTSNVKSISLLDSTGNKEFDDYVHNGEKKIGTKVTYRLSDRGPHRSASQKNNKISKAVEAFNDAVKNKIPLPQSVYDSFPIQVVVGEGKEKITFLPAKPGPKKSSSEKKKYEENYAAERRVIIDMLYNGKIPTTTVKHTSGGQLQTQRNENNFVAENNIKDLKQVSESEDGPMLVYSNVNGELTEMDKKTNYPHRKLSVGKDKDGKPMPYRGGLFLILKKADGTPFPVRMNFLKNTKEQATVLADILSAVSVSKEGKKQYSLKTPLSLIDLDLQEQIREEFAAEVAFFEDNVSESGSVGNEDPTIGDLINMFVYFNEKTKGLTSQLYMKDDSLYFGDKGQKLDSTSESSSKEELIDFLTNVKRRQLSLKMWNDTRSFPGYRDFVMDNNIINTNVITFKNEFETETAEQYEEAGGSLESGRKRRRIQLYVAPLSNKTAAVPAEPAKGSSVKKVVSSSSGLVGDQGVANDIQDQVGPTPLEINEEIKKKFKGIYYTLNGFKRTDGGPIRQSDIDVLNEIVDRLTKDKLSVPTVAEVAEVKEPVKNEDPDKVETLRAEEQAELLNAIPNAEKYLTDGKVDKTKIKNKAHLAKFEKIYKKYDILISPLLPSKQTASKTSNLTAKELNDKKEEIIFQRDFKIKRLREMDPSDPRSKITEKEVENKVKEAQETADKELADLGLTEVSDDVISNVDPNELPSRPVRARRGRKRSIGSKLDNTDKPETSEVTDDDSIKKKYDKGKLNCNPGAK
jgi:hypothetical protein